MEIFEDSHDEPHYHLGSDNHNQPTAQNKIFKKIIKELKEKLPPGLSLLESSEYSVTVCNNGGQTYLWLNCYKYARKQWRVKIVPHERGEDLFERILKPLIKTL